MLEIKIPHLLGAVTLVSATHTAYLYCLVRKRLATQTVMTRPLKASIERARKAHKKSIAFYPIFLMILWASGLFCNEKLAAATGLVYILGRHMYAYSEQTRVAKMWHILGYYTVVMTILLLSLTGTTGLLQVIMEPYVDINGLLRQLSLDSYISNYLF